MKGYTDFALGFLGASAVATKPIGNKKFMDWQKVKQIVADHPDSTIYAGLQEDWGNTSGLIYKNGKYYDGGSFFGCSIWATPILDVDGEEIECWTEKETEERSSMPEWWGEGQPLLDGWTDGWEEGDEE